MKLFGSILIFLGGLQLARELLNIGANEDSSQLIAKLVIPLVPMILGFALWQKKNVKA